MLWAQLNTLGIVETPTTIIIPRIIQNVSTQHRRLILNRLLPLGTAIRSPILIINWDILGLHCRGTLIALERVRNPIRQAFSYGIRHVFIAIQWTVTHSSFNHNENMPYRIPYENPAVRDSASSLLFALCDTWRLWPSGWTFVKEVMKWWGSAGNCCACVLIACTPEKQLHVRAIMMLQHFIYFFKQWTSQIMTPQV